jgi:hypothetical protein
MLNRDAQNLYRLSAGYLLVKLTFLNPLVRNSGFQDLEDRRGFAVMSRTQWKADVLLEGILLVLDLPKPSALLRRLINVPRESADANHRPDARHHSRSSG